jgi:hypothetical protein
MFKINKELLDENLIKDSTFAERYFVSFNQNILNKYKLWAEEIAQNEKKNTNHQALVKTAVEVEKGKKEFEQLKTLELHETNEIEQYKINMGSFNTDNEDMGFALLRGNNWLYYMKKLYCILGRSPVKHGVSLDNKNSELGNITWLVDVDLGQSRKISKQHALIAYNFETCSFEIKNLSKKIPIKVNGEYLSFNEEMPLSSKSSIIIGNQEFYFLLPL